MSRKPPKRTFTLPPGPGGSMPNRLHVERVEDLIDMRTTPGRALLDLRREIVADLGGEASVSAAKGLLLDQLIVVKALGEILGSWLLQHALEGVGTNKDLIDWMLALDRVQQREGWLLVKLGIERKPARTKTALEIAQEFDARKKAAAEHGHAPPRDRAQADFPGDPKPGDFDLPGGAA